MATISQTLPTRTRLRPKVLMFAFVGLMMVFVLIPGLKPGLLISHHAGLKARSSTTLLAQSFSGTNNGFN